MSVREGLLARLEEAAKALGDELDGLVLVGGSALALYPLRAGTALRPTLDVDLVLDDGLAGFYGIQERLLALGFSPDAEGPVCRLRRGALVLDVMPADAAVLGFANRWYPRTVSSAEPFPLPSGRTIRAAPPLLLAATKCEAFLGRGGGDFLASHDLEDLFALLAGDEHLRAEIASGTGEPERYLRRTLAGWMNSPDFVSAISGHFPGDQGSQDRARELIGWLRTTLATVD